LLTKALRWAKGYWKRALTLLACIATGTALSWFVLQRGIEFGRTIGHCELSCSIMGAEWDSLNSDGDCRCVMENGFYFSVPIEHSFFD